MESKNWIKLNRKIFNNNLWEDKEPFDKRSAWIDLLLLANHKDHKIIHNGRIIVAKRGDVNRSMHWLADRWHWSFKKVLRFLKLLEGDGAVTRNSTTDGTIITIINYNKYQNQGTTNGTSNDTTDDTSSGTSRALAGHLYKKEEERKRKYKNDSLSPEAQKKWAEIRSKVGGTK